MPCCGTLGQTVCMAARAQACAIQKAPVSWLFLVFQRRKSICTDSVPSLTVGQAGKRHASLQVRRMVSPHMAVSVSIWRVVPQGPWLGLASSLLSGWLDIPGMNILPETTSCWRRWLGFFLLEDIPAAHKCQMTYWKFMPKYNLFCKAIIHVAYFCGAHGEQSETHRGVKKGWEQERVCWGWEWRERRPAGLQALDLV